MGFLTFISHGPLDGQPLFGPVLSGFSGFTMTRTHDMEDERSATALKQEKGVSAAMNRTLVPSSNDLRVYQRSAYVISSSFHSFESLRA